MIGMTGWRVDVSLSSHPLSSFRRVSARQTCHEKTLQKANCVVMSVVRMSYHSRASIGFPLSSFSFPTKAER